MRPLKIDLNCDVGEGTLWESDFFPYISSCNIACGGHYGDNRTMKSTIALAKKNNVKIGAHPSYPDRENFGRISISISDENFSQSMISQMDNFEAIMAKEQARLHHIKPHGALYNDIAKDEYLARVFLKSIYKYKTTTYLYVPYASVISKLAIDQGFKIKYEVFIDRNYNSDYSLVSRKMPNAIKDSKVEILKHILRIMNKRTIKTVMGSELSVRADTFCLHGDNPNAMEVLKYLSRELPKHNITIQK